MFMVMLIVGAMVETLAKKLKGVMWYGGMTDIEKEKSKEKFKKDKECRVFVGQLHSAGQGLDGLQHVCKTAVFAECYGVSEVIEQAMNRLYRMGQNSVVDIHMLVLKGSKDEHMVNSMVKKNSVIHDVVMKSNAQLV